MSRINTDVTSVVKFVRNREIGVQKTQTSSLQYFLEDRDEIDFLYDVIDENTDMDLYRYQDPVVAEMKQHKREEWLKEQKERRMEVQRERRIEL